MKLINRLKIRVISPSSPVSKDKIQKSKKFIESLGFDVELSKNSLKKEKYLSGSDEERANDLIEAFSNKSVDIIWISRGGYGSIRLLEKIKDLNVNGNKILIGYSDATALFSHFSKFKNILLLYGPSFSELFDKNQYSQKSLFSAIKKEPFSINCKGEKEIKHLQILGGCLSIIVSLLGTPFFPDFEDKFLFIEDINEPTYKVDRMLFQLKLSGVFEKVKGIVVGNFFGLNSKEVISLLREILKDDKPIIHCQKAGHCNFKTTIPFLQGSFFKDNKLYFFFEK